MINKILGALAAATLSVMPAVATVDENTTELLNYVESQGIPVFINDHAACDSNQYLGVYFHRGMHAAMHWTTLWCCGMSSPSGISVDRVHRCTGPQRASGFMTGTRQSRSVACNPALCSRQLLQLCLYCCYVDGTLLNFSTTSTQGIPVFNTISVSISTVACSGRLSCALVMKSALDHCGAPRSEIQHCVNTARGTELILLR